MMLAHRTAPDLHGDYICLEAGGLTTAPPCWGRRSVLMISLLRRIRIIRLSKTGLESSELIAAFVSVVGAAAALLLHELWYLVPVVWTWLRLGVPIPVHLVFNWFLFYFVGSFPALHLPVLDTLIFTLSNHLQPPGVCTLVYVLLIPDTLEHGAWPLFNPLHH